MAVIQGNAHKSSVSGAVTQQSLKFNDDESQYLSWTPAAAGNRKTWTWSGWVKRGNIDINQYLFQARIDDSATEGNKVTFYFMSSNKLRILNQTTVWKETSAVFRDTSAWYHIVLSVDTTNATTNNRIRIYINGEEASYSTNTGPSLNADLAVNSTNNHYIGQEHGGASYLDGYLSDINFIDGQALDPTSFGQFTNGYWEAIDYAGTYGTNGFHLTFEDDVVSEGFNTVTYRGTGASQSVSGLGLAADLVWIKRRNNTASINIYDVVRGVQKRIKSDSTDAEDTRPNGLTSFDSDGFTVVSDAGVNASGDSYVAWAWDAGSGSAASNTDGSITSTVKANPSYGFSIVSYTGNGSSNQTVGHGLSVAPDLLIMKNRDDAENWQVNHSSITDGIFNLNTTDAKKDHTAFSTGAIDPAGNTSTVFSMYDGSANTDYPNESGKDYIVYCFAEVAGYSSIGSYSGTGAAGNAITTGFRPAFLMIKRTDTTGNWEMLDDMRNISNDPVLYANTSAAESAAAGRFTFTSTGFTLDDTGGGRNASGGTYIYMAFADTREAAFWKDVSGQGNHWTPNNLDYRDSLIDSPANNFATLNPLDNLGASMTLSEGNLKVVCSGGSGRSAYSNFYMDSGSWYIEATGVENSIQIGGVNGSPYFRYNGSGTYSNNGTIISGKATYTNTDIVAVAYNADTQAIEFFKNNSSQGSVTFSAAAGVSVNFCLNGTASQTDTMIANFGQDSTFSGNTTAGGNQDDNGIGDFKYAPPSGYLALCTANLPTPTIVDGSEHFNTVLWTGDGTASNAITGVGFEPDLVWTKARNYPRHHWWFDQVRGAEKWLQSSNSDYEGDQNAGLMSFDADGFTYKYLSNQGFNTNNETYASWNWKAGGTAVSNTAGSITSQVSANVDAGFSIVSYVADGTNTSTVGHGLSIEPKMVIQKNRSAASDWLVYTDLVDGSDDYLLLNSTAAKGNAAGGATATVFNSWDRTSGNNMIAYCFHSVEGFSKVGSYIGNGSSDGPFVYTGFRPAFILLRESTNTNGWFVHDSVRSTYNQVTNRLYPHLSNAEDVGGAYGLDFTSNGFKIRTSDTGWNRSGGTFIFLAFAETPFKYANAR